MEIKETEQPKLYPNLEPLPRQPTAPNIYNDVDSGHTYRLQKIGEIQKTLEAERDKRYNLAKKYQRSINIISGCCYLFEITSVGLGTAGIALLSTIIATPVVMAMEGVAIGAGGLSVAGNLICNKVLSSKAKKHLQIKLLAESKLNKINDHVSKALKDSLISDEEFTLILSELEKFYELKQEIRSKTKSKIDDETKQSLIKQGKEQAVEQFRNMFGKSS